MLTSLRNPKQGTQKKRQPLRRWLAAVIGYVLSPLSWWNDLLVNVPLAYAFAYPFSRIDSNLYLPAFILGYWLSNLIGFLLMHWGVSGLIHSRLPKPSLRQYAIVTLLYSVMITVLVLIKWLPDPSDLIAK